MILYDYVLSASCYKVRLMAALLGTPLNLRAVNFHPGREHKSTEMLALNPKGTLPILQDGDTVLTDSADILQHLTADHPEWQSADDDRWLAFASDLNDSLGLARLHDVIGYEADIDKARAAGVSALRNPTIADIACFPNTALTPDGGVSLDPYPSIRLWMRAIRSLPGFIEMPGIHRLHELAHPA